MAITKKNIRNRMERVAEKYDTDLKLYIRGVNGNTYTLQKALESGGVRDISPHFNNQQMYAYLQGLLHADKLDA